MLYESIVSKTPINKGWSADRKFLAVTASGKQYLLRISDISLKERKEKEFIRMKQAAELGISMCKPLEFGCCKEGVYTIHSWIEGDDAENVLPTLSQDAQYALGLDAGQMLRKIHSIPCFDKSRNWGEFFGRKAERKIKSYLDCSLKYENGAYMIRFMKENEDIILDRPVTYQHGDYHTGNMMIGEDKKLYIIDFEKDDYGDPWEEFNRIVWTAQSSPEFATGMVNGYFEGEIPAEFWPLIAYYICSNSLGSLPWAISYGQGEVDTMIRQQEEILSWYDNMTKVVPNWYKQPNNEGNV